jgi:hypothetical protein
MLLARGDFSQIKRMASDLLVEDEAQRVPWFNALLYACSATKDSEPLAHLASVSPAPPGWCLQLAAIEQTVIAGHRDEARAKLLRMPVRPDSNFVPYYHADRLLRLGFASETLRLLEQHAPLFSAAEASSFRLRAFARLGWRPSLRTEFESALASLAAPQMGTLLAAHLLRHPDVDQAADFARAILRLNPDITPQSYPVVAAAYLACRHAGAERAAADLLKLLQVGTSSRAGSLEILGSMLVNSRREPVRLDLVLPTTALPIEAIYTLLELHPPPTR